ncbi:MAG: hypothetical protein IKT40_09600, partial [Bacilli bacterium]|nr:hypothetical protein [Bacilli bacterium]
MMKTFKMFAFSILTFMVMVMGVNAAGDVAKVNDEPYDLSEFMTYLAGNTAAGDEITLLQDLDLTSILSEGDKFYVPFKDNVVFDLNGHSVTSKNNTIRYMGNNLTIKNGKFIVNGYGTQNEGSYALFIGHKSGATAGYTLEDLVLEGGLNVFNAEGVELNNVTATGTNFYAVWADINAEITIKSGNYSSKSGVILNNEETTGLITVQGGTFNDFIPGIYVGAGAPITVKLTEDMELNGVQELFGNLTLDLNGHNIIQKQSGANVFNVISGDINITGKGKIISHENANNAIRIYGSTEVEDKDFTKVTIGKDVTVESNGYAAFITHNDKRAYGVEVNIYGTLKGGYNGFFVNGTIQDVDKNNFKNFPVVNIYEGAKISGIYAGGYATWNIGAATIEDEGFGIGVKAGKFEIDGATIKATGEKEDPIANNNGISHTGSGIQFETNAEYADHIDMIIKNATLE